MEKNRNLRKLKWLVVDAKILETIFGRGIVAPSRIDEEIEDLKIVDVVWEFDYDRVKLLITSESFEEVELGKEIPWHNPRMFRLSAEEYAKVEEKEYRKNLPKILEHFLNK